MLDKEVAPKTEDVPPATEAAVPEPAEKTEPEPVEEVHVTELENPEETPLVEESPAPEPVPGSSSEVREIPVDAEPVIATPLVSDIAEHVVEPVVTEGTPAIDSVEDVTPAIVPERQYTLDEPEPPVPEVAEQEDPVLTASEPIIKPAAEEGSTSDPLEPDLPAPGPVLGEAPPAKPEPVSEPQESETLHPLAPLEEELSSEETPPTIPEPVEVVQDAPTSDILQEETKQVESSWTPSYSVSTQGGGLDVAPSADEEVIEPTPAPETPVEESAAEPEPAAVPEISTAVEVCVFNVSLPSWQS